MNYFKTNLKYLRKRFDLTQSELALQLNTGQSTIATWENGSSSPDVDNLIKFYRTFNISIHSLIIDDMAHGNLITDDHVKQFKRKGNLTGNPIGNPMAKKGAKYLPSNAPLTMFNEADETATWVFTKLLKTMHSDIEKINKTVEDINKKVSK